MEEVVDLQCAILRNVDEKTFYVCKGYVQIVLHAPYFYLRVLVSLFYASTAQHNIITIGDLICKEWREKVEDNHLTADDSIWVFSDGEMFE